MQTTARGWRRWRGPALAAVAVFALIAVLIVRPLGGVGAAVLLALVIAAALFVLFRGEREAPEGRLDPR